MNYNKYHTPLFFIVGKGRSGSTLLQILLDAHPNILIPIESRFFIHLYTKYHSLKRWKKTDLASFYNDLFLEEKIDMFWKIDREHLRNEILNQPSTTSFASLCKLVYHHYQSFFYKEEIRLLGDKNPINSLFIYEINKVFPEAKFIHLVRDPRAACLSHVKAFPRKSLTFAALKWKEHNLSIEKAKANNPAAFITITYEALTRFPEETLRKLTDFLGVYFHPSMLNHQEAVKEELLELSAKTLESDSQQLKADLFSKFHKNLIRPINTNSIHTWKKELNTNEITQIEHICAKLMPRYGYVQNTKRNTFRQLSFLQKLKHVLWKPKIRLYYLMPFSWRMGYNKIVHNEGKLNA